MLKAALIKSLSQMEGLALEDRLQQVPQEGVFGALHIEVAEVVGLLGRWQRLVFLDCLEKKVGGAEGRWLQ